ncbi:MAG: hypothetical protein ACYDDH_12040, partial [Candidatus Desulforudaceae bacterium]
MYGNRRRWFKLITCVVLVAFCFTFYVPGAEAAFAIPIGAYYILLAVGAAAGLTWASGDQGREWAEWYWLSVATQSVRDSINAMDAAAIDGMTQLQDNVWDAMRNWVVGNISDGLNEVGGGFQGVPNWEGYVYPYLSNGSVTLSNGDVFHGVISSNLANNNFKFYKNSLLIYTFPANPARTLTGHYYDVYGNGFAVWITRKDSADIGPYTFGANLTVVSSGGESLPVNVTGKPDVKGKTWDWDVTTEIPMEVKLDKVSGKYVAKPMHPGLPPSPGPKRLIGWPVDMPNPEDVGQLNNNLQQIIDVGLTRIGYGRPVLELEPDNPVVDIPDAPPVNLPPWSPHLPAPTSTWQTTQNPDGSITTQSTVTTITHPDPYVWIRETVSTTTLTNRPDGLPDFTYIRGIRTTVTQDPETKVYTETTERWETEVLPTTTTRPLPVPTGNVYERTREVVVVENPDGSTTTTITTTDIVEAPDGRHRTITYVEVQRSKPGEPTTTTTERTETGDPYLPMPYPTPTTSPDPYIPMPIPQPGDPPLPLPSDPTKPGPVIPVPPGDW